ncbi:type II toxin-antitoxin system VapC family toxin [Methylobacterium oxalidis]|uniref:type II toxin-antitoxin system VapC family toxin n=1 Tax=Methylobacterium oxalidis TaxID=944322 RepID=UPI0033161C26
MSDVLVIDTSVYVAILFEEPDADLWSRAIRARPRRVMAAGTYLECAIVTARRALGHRDLDDWLNRESIEVLPVDHALARRAADAFARYGRDRHPAALNVGDGFADALAASLGAPLLFKGEDFARTDVARAGP